MEILLYKVVSTLPWLIEKWSILGQVQFLLDCTHSVNVSAQPMQHFSYRLVEVEAMWKHVYIVMFPHFEDKLLLSMRDKCGNMSI